MSTTSASEEGTLYVLDEPALIERKLKRAVTDSGEGSCARPTSPGSPT
jgi:tryptophanyl-tRNA synthetase